MTQDFYRYKITVEYLGSGFAGWQRQNGVLSIQQVLEDAILQFTQERVVLYGAGRTDAGVHAIQQVAHFDLKSYLSQSKVMHAINHFIKGFTIGITQCEIVDNCFHARFSAIQRHYMYRIINRPTNTVIDNGRVWWIKYPLNIEIMKSATKYLIGKHDFSAFRSKSCQASSPIKTLSNIIIHQDNNEIRLFFSAPSFLHNMIRNIVGSLILIGSNKWPLETLEKALDLGKLDKALLKAPAFGLYFLGVDY